MTDLSTIIASIEAEGQAALDRCYALLGARPGPGIDIEFHPTAPASNIYTIVPITACGKAYIQSLAGNQSYIARGYLLRTFKAKLTELGLTSKISWGKVVTKVDP